MYVSWENGSLSRALTEYYLPAQSPFSPDFLPILTNLPTNQSISRLDDLAQATLANKIASYGEGSTSKNWNLTWGNALSMLDDQAAGDPASLGEVVVWYNYTQSGAEDYGIIAEQEVRSHFFTSFSGLHDS